MSDASNTVLQQALELSSTEKAKIIEALLSSLDTPDSELDKIWAEEADARIDAFEKGELKAVTADSVLSKYTR